LVFWLYFKECPKVTEALAEAFALPAAYALTSSITTLAFSFVERN
jgi:hypothetical protein